MEHSASNIADLTERSRSQVHMVLQRLVQHELVLRRVLEQLDLPHGQVAIVGDRVFTDVLAGNRLGLYTVLVKPVNPNGEPCRHDHWQRLEVRLAQLAGASLR